jgi:hypothetical protein
MSITYLILGYMMLGVGGAAVVIWLIIQLILWLSESGD